MTTIVIQGNNAFRQAVLDDLSEICPCWRYAAQADGTLVVTNDSGDDVDCWCYCEHRAGCNLVSDLDAHANTTTIRRTGQGNSYSPGTNTVDFNPDRDEGGVNAHGDRRRPPSIGLAHELIHALHDHEGDLGATVELEEFTTSREENQIRREVCEPHRTQYGGVNVPNPHTGDIDDSDRHNCDCNSIAKLIVRLVRCLACHFKLAARRAASILRRLLRASPMAAGPAGTLERLVEDEPPGRLRDAVKQTLQLRAQTPEHARVEKLWTEFAGARTVAVLESVDVGGGAILFATMADDGERIVAETNFSLRDEDDDIAFGEPVEVRRTVARRDDVRAAATALAEVRFASGIGGQTDLYDGTVQFLTVRHGDETMAAALYGYRYRLLDGREDESVRDADRASYVAISSVLDALRAVLASSQSKAAPTRAAP